MPTSLPSGSFIAAPVSTPNALANQAERSPAVLERYRSALSLGSVQEVAPILRSLHLTALSRPGMYRVYYARPQGMYGYKIRRIPAGTAVFSDAAGRPVALKICGNPLHALSPAQTAKMPYAREWTPSESDSGLIMENSAPSGDFASAFSAPTPASFVDNAPLVDAGTLDSVAAYAGSLPTAVSSTATGTVSSGGLLSAIVGAVTVAGHGGGSNGSTTTTTTSSALGSAPPAVPEPGWAVFAPTMLLALGLCLTWGRLRERQRKQSGPRETRHQSV